MVHSVKRPLHSLVEKCPSQTGDYTYEYVQAAQYTHVYPDKQ